MENKKLYMSFYDGSLNKEELKKFIKETDKPIVYTYGFAFRHPSTLRKPVTKDQAYEIVDKEGWLDATETDEYLHLNAYSENDMW